jgi:hypothetical protein
MFIPDSKIFHSGSRILHTVKRGMKNKIYLFLAFYGFRAVLTFKKIKEKVFLKYCKKISPQNVPDPGSGKNSSWNQIPDPGRKKAPDPGCGSEKLHIIYRNASIFLNYGLLILREFLLKLLILTQWPLRGLWEAINEKKNIGNFTKNAVVREILNQKK